MKKTNLLASLWTLTLALAVPQLTYSYCPQEEKTGWNFVDDILIWQAHEDGLGFTTKANDVLTTDNYTENSLVHPNFKYDYGFRLGLGYSLQDCSWTFDAEWIHILNSAHKRVKHNSGAPDFEGTFPVWSMSPDTLASDYVSNSSAKWHLHTDIVDLNIQRNYYVGQNVFLLPFIGVRGALLQQKLTANYDGGVFYTGEDKNTMRNRFCGVGPRFGAEADYQFYRCFNLFGTLAVAPLYGHFRTSHREYYEGVERYRNYHNFHHFVLSFDYSVGIKWKGIVLDTWPEIILGASWESQNFYQQNRLNRGQYGFFKHNRELSLSGLTLSGALDF